MNSVRLSFAEIASGHIQGRHDYWDRLAFWDKVIRAGYCELRTYNLQGRRSRGIFMFPPSQPCVYYINYRTLTVTQH